MKMNSKKAFTLIELLIVIAIIGILAVAFLPSLLGAPAKGRDAQRLATVQKIQSFLVSESVVGTSLPASGCIDSDTPTVGEINILINSNIADFGGTFPKDPQASNTMAGPCATAAASNGAYGYVKFTTAGATYTAGVYAHMENVENANILCSDIATATNPALLAASALTATNANCYLALF